MKIKKDMQQGYVLAFALIMLLFASIIINSALERTSLEGRISHSHLMVASISSAAESGALAVGVLATDFPSQKEIASVCEDFFLDVADVYSEPNEYMDSPQIWWRYNGLDSQKDCSALESSSDKVRFFIDSWQGASSQENLVYTTRLSALIGFMVDQERSGLLPENFDKNAALSWGKIDLSGSGSIYGGVTANEVVMRGGASIYGNAGNPALISTPNLDKPDWMNLPNAELSEDYSAIENDPIQLQDQIDKIGIEQDGIQDLNSQLGGRNIGQYGAGQVVISPDGVQNFQGGTGQLSPLKSIDFLGIEGAAFYSVNELRLQSGGQGDPTLLIEGGDVIIYVAGDVHFGGSTSLQIAGDSSLTLIVEGRTVITEGFQFMNQNVVNDRGSSVFSILSNYSSGNSAETGISVSGGAHIHGFVYSAHSKINISGGSYVRGQVMGANLDLSGGTAVYYEDTGVSSWGNSFYQPNPRVTIEFDTL